VNKDHPNYIKYPSFILGVNAEVIKKILTPNVLDGQNTWYLNDAGADHLWELSDDKPNSPRINGHLVIRRRQELEKDSSVLQLLPYTMIGWVDEQTGAVSVSTYYRKKGTGENRMAQATHGKDADVMSFGWGGHVEMIDIAWKEDGDLDLDQTIFNNIVREKAEECIFTDTRTNSEVSIHALLDDHPLRPQGYIYDTRNEVGQHHLAIVNLLVLPAYITVTKREAELMQGPVMTLEELNANIASFEPWSEIIVRSHYVNAAAFQESVTALAEQHKEVDYHKLARAAGQAESPADTPSNVVREAVLDAAIVKETAQ
jgi:predicted NUDIX family phosphoesterase